MLIRISQPYYYSANEEKVTFHGDQAHTKLTPYTSWINFFRHKLYCVRNVNSLQSILGNAECSLGTEVHFLFHHNHYRKL